MSSTPNISLEVSPTTPARSLDQFTGNYPNFSIALDGFVSGPPKFVPISASGRGPFLNLNHHEGVGRLETRATCSQALGNIRAGLFRTFCNPSGVPHAILWVNDCDHDVCMSVYLLMHAFMARAVVNPRLNRLVHMTDMLDTTAGAYVFPHDMPSFEELAWVYRPYEIFRANGGIDRKDGTEFRSIISDVGQRIQSYIVGMSDRVELDTRYEIIGVHKNWKMVREIGANARLGMYRDGIEAFVTARMIRGGRYTYSVGRKSIFIPFDIPRILEALNQAEADSEEFWGGSETIGGSPRVKGSRLHEDEVAQIINSVI